MVHECSDVRTSEKPGIDLPDGIPYLTSFYLYLTTGCNLHCRHCWVDPDGDPDAPYGRVLSPELLKAAIDEAKPMGLVSIKLTGGEPMLHPRFPDIVTLIKGEGLSADMETNGTLLTPETVTLIRDHSSIRFISVSLDSHTPEYHDAFRGKKGAWQATVNGIGYLVSAGIHPQIIMSVSHENLAMVEDLVALAIRLRAGSVKFNPVSDVGRGRDMTRRGVTLDFDELMQFKDRILNDLQPRVPIPLLMLMPPAVMSVGEILRTARPGGTCSVLNTIGILGSGDYAMCGIGQNCPEMRYGTLGKDSLREIWLNHPSICALRKGLTRALPQLCDDCIHSTRCIAHCAAMNYIHYGERVHASWHCVEAERRGLFPETRRRSYGTG
ncbi:MAG TPA: radical SAM protein [bacterium]|nr:radical SAM protein [bacterium]